MTTQNAFNRKHYGKIDNKPVEVFFQSDRCYDKYCKGKLLPELGITIEPAETGACIQIYWFDSLLSRDSYIAENYQSANSSSTSSKKS